MRKILMALLGMFAAVTMAACSSSSNGSGSPAHAPVVHSQTHRQVAPSAPLLTDSQFAAFIREHLSNEPLIAQANDSDIAMLGHSVCGGFRNGATLEDEANVFVYDFGDKPFTYSDAGYFIGASVQAFCPQYKPRLGLN